MRKIAISLTILFTIIIYSCSLFLPDEDETAPVIVIDTPSSFDVLYETVLVTCTATDEEGVVATELYIDDATTGMIDSTAPYTFDWNTLEYEDGSSHIIYVQGWDINDNYSNSDTISVIVDNSTIHPAPIENINFTYQPIGYLINWPLVEHERFISYTLLRSEKVNMEGSVTLFSSEMAADTVFFDSLANPLINYFYQLMITDDLNYISIGAIVESPSPTSFIPSGVTAAPSDTTIRLRWDDNSEFESGFIIERDGGSGYEELAEIAENTTEYLDANLTYDKQYRYRISITYEDANSEFSNIAYANSPLGFSPTNLEADATTLTIILRWDDNCIFESGFRLERDAGLGWVPLVELGANVTGYEDADLEYDRNYRYRVAAFTETMRSNYSTYYSIYSPLMFAPTNLALTTTDTSIILNWEDQCVFETGFIIQRSENSATGSGYLSIDTVVADVVTYTDFNIEEDAWYYYRVAAYVPEERSGYSSTSGIGSPLNFAPTSLTATSVDTSIQLRWTDNCIFEDGFILERDAGSGFELLAELPENITGYLDSDMEYGIEYHYRVAAIVDDDVSEYTWEVSRFSPLQFAPSYLTASHAGNSIQLVWNDNCNFEEGYILERNAGSDYVQIATLGVNATTFLDSDMSYDVTYRYRLVAFTSSGESDYATSASIRSPLGFAPTNLSVVSNDTSITVSWLDECIFEEGFIIERNAGTGYVILDSIESDATNYMDSDLSEDEYYQYRVAAFAGGIQSDYAWSVNIASPIKFAPFDLFATAVSNSIVVRWTDLCTFEEGFTIERDDGEGFEFMSQVAANTTNYIDLDLDYGVEYRYRAVAFTADEVSNYSNITTIISPLTFTPSSLFAFVNNNSIDLSWQDNCTFETGFHVERDAGSGFVSLANVGANVTTHSDADLLEGVTYRYRISAFTAILESEYSATITVESPIVFTPVNLQAVPQSNSIDLSWDDNCSFEEGFKIERDDGTGIFVEIADLGANYTAYSDTDLEYNIVYRYRVAAYSATEQSNYTQIINVLSPLAFAPVNLRAVTQENSIFLSWVDNCSFEEGFKIERDDGSGVFVEIADLGANFTTYSDVNLAYNTVYSYRVAAYTATEQSNYTPTVNAQSTLVFAPVNLQAVAHDNSIDLSWTDNCSFEEGFKIERDDGSGVFVEIADLGANFTAYSDMDLVYNTVYSYRMAAYTATEQSNYTQIVNVLSPLAFAPVDLQAIAQENSINLSWVDICSFEEGFKIERDDGSGVFVEIADLGANFTAYSDMDLEYNTVYSYRVAAYTATEQSNYTQIVNVLSSLVFAPENLQAVTQSYSIDLSWTDNCSFEDGFIIERDDGSGNFVEISDLSANFTSYSDEDIEYYTVYRYRVAAYTATDQSSYTPIINVQSPVDITPSNLVATSFDTEILLEWQDNSTAEEGFRVYRHVDDVGVGFDFDSPLAELSADVTEYTDYAAVYGDDYIYIVSAFANGQESDYTNEASGSIAWLYSEWVTIPAGTYSLGHADVPSGEFDHVLPADIEMMRFEVTNNQYAAFMEEALVAGEIYPNDDGTGLLESTNDNLIYNLSMTGHHIKWDGSAFTIDQGYELHPVTGVSWYGADAFATFYGWSLPTEEEWEVGARGDTEADYPWGNDDPTCELANFSGCADELIPVGQREAGMSPFDIHDMVGNAWEWTDSFFDVANDSYVLRGGSWSNYTDNLKVWFRTEGIPTATYNTIGFRCVR